MSTDPQAAPRPLPDRPNLRHLKDQARDLLETGAAVSITELAHISSERQSAAQPSPLTLLPSSHTSSGVTNLLPQPSG